MNDSDIRQGNSIFWENMDSNVREKVWKAISKLRVVPKEKGKDYKKNIKEMKVNDNKRMLDLRR